MNLPALLLVLSTSASATIIYPVVDTGQTSAYGEYNGQDAHYAANVPSYKDNADGTVSDLVTGLMWTQAPGEKMTLAEAEKGAGTCRTGGYSDWRLPTIKELYSLIQLNGTDPDPRSRDTSGLTPFIDADFFKFQYGREENGERIIDAQYASSTRYVSTTMGGNKTMFGVNFADGRIKGYPIKSRRGEGTYYVIYVRGNPEYGKNDFKDNGDGTITDEATGLVWMQADSGTGKDWPTALEYAESMEFAGYSDWRLPSAKELQSIIDYTRSPDTTDSAAIDPIFKATEIENEGGEKDFAHYWASSTHVGVRSSDTAVYFAFGRSLGFMPDRQSGEKILMDVHGAGSQRSDPKTGDASNFPEGRGPQGDVIRIDNMVRLVRGGNIEKISAPAPAQTTPHRETQEGETKPRLLKRFDLNGDGEISKAEFKGPDRRFNRIDTDQNGVISEAEANDAPTPPGQNKNHKGRGDPRPFKEAATLPAAMPRQGSEPQPNIVFILADDMGWTGTSVEMISGNPATRSDYYKTPNLEKLAKQGMSFSQAYSPAALCTPSRAAILTGKTAAENQITTPGRGKGSGTEKLSPPRQRNDIPAEETTIPEALKSVGYATAHLGKWHIGRGNPGDHGFDIHDGSTGNECKGSAKDPKEIFSITERAIDFMTGMKKAGRPFYLQLSHYAVHTPTETRPATKSIFEGTPGGKYHNDAAFAGMTLDLDQSISTLLETIEQLGIAETTYVVFMSDNGAPGNPRKPQNAPLNAGKGSLYEGGIRVPLIIAGPDIKQNSTSIEPVTGCDLFPTFCGWAKASCPESIEGNSLIPLLNGKEFSRTEESFLFHYPHYGQGPTQKPQSAIIAGDFKLLKDWETETCQLFDLSKDIGEQTDLSTALPEKLAEMKKIMSKRLKATNAQLPTPNPDYDPETTSQRRGRRQGQDSAATPENAN